MTRYSYLINHIKHRGILRLESDELNSVLQSEGLLIIGVYFLARNGDIGVHIADNEVGKRYTVYFDNIPDVDEVIGAMR